MNVKKTRHLQGERDGQVRSPEDVPDGKCLGVPPACKGGIVEAQSLAGVSLQEVKQKAKTQLCDFLKGMTGQPVSECMMVQVIDKSRDAWRGATHVRRGVRPLLHQAQDRQTEGVRSAFGCVYDEDNTRSRRSRSRTG